MSTKRFSTVMKRLLSWKTALLFSLTVHLLLGLLVVIFPSKEKEKEKPFVTRLVNPDELEKRQESTPRPPSPFRPSASAKRADNNMVRPRLPLPLRQPQQVPASRQPKVPPSSQEPEKAAGEIAKGASPAPAPGSAASGGLKESEPVRPLPAAKPGGSQGFIPSPSIRERLFDREVVEKFAKREEQPNDNTLTFHNEEFKYRTYMERLKEKIESIWRYPPEAAMQGIYGDLYIRFTIKKNGMLGDIELVRTSGHRSLDEAAQQALRDAQPYWPLPAEWGKDDITITGHFVYSIYGTSIR